MKILWCVMLCVGLVVAGVCRVAEDCVGDEACVCRGGPPCVEEVPCEWPCDGAEGVACRNDSCVAVKAVGECFSDVTTPVNISEGVEETLSEAYKNLGREFSGPLEPVGFGSSLLISELPAPFVEFRGFALYERAYQRLRKSIETLKPTTWRSLENHVREALAHAAAEEFGIDLKDAPDEDFDAWEARQGPRGVRITWEYKSGHLISMAPPSMFLTDEQFSKLLDH